GKVLLRSYMLKPTTWQIWAARETAPDFKSKKFNRLSDFPALTAIDEGDPITYTSVSGSKETATLKEYKAGIKFTKQAMINDEMQAGNHQVIWDAEDFSSGMYFYKIQAGKYSESRKMLLVK
ncbi:MAG: hypothetical protein GY839_07425, partial [candidate division Zixibacteria bacterium]|nr:hypothetical protein [candidate division Zixibacteria bacterium]